MKQFILILSIFTLFSACSSSPETENTGYQLNPKLTILYKAVGDRHDVAMLLMKDIHSTSSQLKATIEKHAKLKSVEEQCLSHINILQRADKEMMDWMSRFKSVELNEKFYKEMTEEEIYKYLNAQGIKIDIVHRNMTSSIKDGQKYLEIIEAKGPLDKGLEIIEDTEVYF